MLANRLTLGEFKENVKVSSSSKLSSKITCKGLKTRSLNSFVDDNQDVKLTKEIASELTANECKRIQEEKENSKPIIKPAQKEKNSLTQEDWSSIEEMHICDEPDDDYEDILPECDRIQKADFDPLFTISFTYTNFTDEDDYLLSPYPEVLSTDHFGYDFPEKPASSPSPDFTSVLYDDTLLEDSPLF